MSGLSWDHLYYDAMGLLPTRRSANGYRSFGSDAVSQVKQIRTLLATGFRITDIYLLLPCLQQQETGTPLCEAALKHYRQKLAELDEQIQILQGIRQRIEERIQLALPHELPSRTLFSSDAPFGHPLVARTIVEQATSDTTLRKRVLGDNLAELLNLS